MIFIRLRSNRGSALVEFSIVMIAFIVACFILGSFVQITYTWLVLQYANNQGARLVKNLPTELPNAAKLAAIQNSIVTTSNGFGVEIGMGDVLVAFSGPNINIQVSTNVPLTPLGALFVSFGAPGGAITVTARESVRNAQLF